MYSESADCTIESNLIAVAGDVTVDWMVFVPEVAAPEVLQTTYQWEQRDTARILAMPGGAALATILIRSAMNHVRSGNSDNVSGPSVSRAPLTDPSDDSLTRTYTTWQPIPLRTGDPTLVWRMNRFLGVQPGTQSASSASNNSGFPRCLVIDDANLGFRNLEDSWPSCLGSNQPPLHVILKMSNPLVSGPLWNQLTEHHVDQLTVYCSVDDLRKEYAPIGQALSWERTAYDVTMAVRSHADLQQARWVIVSVGMSGALIVERDGPATLIYDPLYQEGDWESERPGNPIGLGTCVAAGLALQANDCPEEPDWVLATSRGLRAARTLHERRLVRPDDDHRDEAHFPLADTAAELMNSEISPFQCVRVSEDDDWTVLGSNYGDAAILAEQLVVRQDAIDEIDLPIERIGAWSSIDRTEIESMRSVRNIIREYLQQPRLSRPLSLAVFGPPGSGKSFAIKQMARQWGKDHCGDEDRVSLVLSLRISQE